MTYYEKFKPEADKLVADLADQVKTLSAQIPKLKKQRDEEADKVRRTRQHIAELKRTANEALSGGQASYEKYRASMKKNNAELEVCEEMSKQMGDVVIPKAESDLKLAKTNLKIKLEQFVVANRIVADREMAKLIRAAFGHRDGFIDAFRRIYADFGLGFVANREELYPGVWSQNEVESIENLMPSNFVWNPAAPDTKPPPKTEQKPETLTGATKRAEKITPFVEPGKDPEKKTWPPPKKEPSAALKSSGKFKEFGT